MRVHCCGLASVQLSYTVLYGTIGTHTFRVVRVRLVRRGLSSKTLRSYRAFLINITFSYKWLSRKHDRRAKTQPAVNKVCREIKLRAPPPRGKNLTRGAGTRW